MYIVLDLEFYHNKKREDLGAIKQLGAFKFDDKYNIVDIFEMTVTKYTTQGMLTTLFNSFAKDIDTIYVWAKNNDIKALNQIMEVTEVDIVDVQSYFKDVNLASLSSVSEALTFETEGRHNALIDAEYTFEVIKHFDLNNEVSRKAIINYINLIRISEGKQQKSIDNKPKEAKKKKITNYNLVSAGSMRKLNDEYYQIVSSKAINDIVETIKQKEYKIQIDGSVSLSNELQSLIVDKADIVFSNTPKFKTIANKYEQKMIVIVDNSQDDSILGIFLSKQIYKKFIK